MQNTCPAITVVSNRDHDNYQNCLASEISFPTSWYCSICMAQVNMIERRFYFYLFIIFISLSLFRKSLSRRRINRMLSNESMPPAFSRSNSQASMDSTSMEDFWCEVESIKESREDGSEEAMLLEFKPADGEHMNTTYASCPGFASCPKSHALISSLMSLSLSRRTNLGLQSF